MKNEKLIEDTLTKLKHNNIEVNLSNERSVLLPDGNTACNGYFDGYRFAVAMGQENWLPIFIHESCHFDQWAEESPYWAETDVELEAWLDGKPSDDENLLFKRLRNVESDCERRTVAKIKEYNLDMDVIQYAQRANAYIYFYHYLQESKTWYTIGKEPYNTKEITNSMPTEVHAVEYYDTVSEDILQLFRKVYG